MLETVLIFLALLFLSGFFSSAELATMSLSRFQVERLVRQKRRHAPLLLRLKQDPHRLLTTILIGNNLVNIAAAAFATAVAINLFGNAGVGIATGITTFLVLLFGEIVPKSLAVSHARTLALAFSPFLYGLQWILSPLIFVVDSLARLITRLFGEPEKERITEEEVAEIARASERQGHIKKREREMIQSVLAFDGRNADEVMTPRLDVFCLEMNTPVREAREQILEAGYSRVPVYEKRMDRMKGVVLVKDLLHVPDEDKKKLKDVMKQVHFVPASRKLDALLRDFQRRKSPFALVMDEHGLFIGLVTVEDLLEELVGEIYDEGDREESKVRKVDGAFLISGKAPIDALNSQHDFSIPAEHDYDTLAGFLTDRFGRIPEEGESLLEGGVTYVAEKVVGHRIQLVRAIREEERTQHPKRR